jgi:diketogulonate reductase-like aldo/keto reductase
LYHILKTNKKVFDFILTGEDMAEIKALNQNYRNYGVDV